MKKQHYIKQMIHDKNKKNVPSQMKIKETQLEHTCKKKPTQHNMSKE